MIYPVIEYAKMEYDNLNKNKVAFKRRKADIKGQLTYPKVVLQLAIQSGKVQSEIFKEAVECLDLASKLINQLEPNEFDQKRG